MSSKAWDDNENSALVTLYFRMLDAAMAGEKYNKAAMIRGAQTSKPNILPLSTRSRGSIEAKLMNATAAHASVEPDAVTMAGFGYVPLCNYQAILRDAMFKAIQARCNDDAVIIRRA